MALNLIITDAGRAALVNAANTGTAPVTIAQVGVSGTAVVAAKNATTLPGEFKRLATIAGQVVADDTIHIVVRDETTDVFTVRSFALYLADGTLFGIYGQAPVLVEKSSGAIMLIAVDVRFADIDAALLAFGDVTFLNPPATTETMGVVELATTAEAIAGTDDRRPPPAKMVRDAVFSWLDARFGVNNAGIWHPSNDGAGSGLDADLLDGQQGSYYLPAGTYTAADIKAKLLLADGSGSGLDADLLDGQEGAYYAAIADRLGYRPANRAGDTFTGSIKRDGSFYFDLLSGNPILNLDANDYMSYDRTANAFGIYIGGAWRLILNSDGTLNVTKAMFINGGTTWHAANDGSGSGLDADLLDGLHASAFMRAADASTYGSNGNGNWEKRANGIIEQWGVVTGTFPQGGYAKTWPTPFTDPSSVNLQITPFNPSGVTTQAGDWWPQTKLIGTNSFEMVVQDSSGTASGAGYHWRALGK